MNSVYSNDKHDNPIVWAVTDMESVPKGSLIINPQVNNTLKAHLNYLHPYNAAFHHMQSLDHLLTHVCMKVITGLCIVIPLHDKYALKMERLNNV